MTLEAVLQRERVFARIRSMGTGGQAGQRAMGVWAVRPLSMVKRFPDTNDASELASQRTRPATSSGRPRRPTG